ncbi:MAG: hypothetical protein NC079_05685 [Clostridium sp.]|nr:hypothetical protein [Acetatifactor muris]MCM1528028.1 hypothetical protein [Bacteroides sp.]MCM1563083.1 hypothetical protein [Clostridium sp.]
MTAFFEEVLEELSHPAFVERVCAKYHYEESRIPELRAVARELSAVTREGAFWERRESSAQDFPILCQADAPGTAYECVVMSLGAGPDRLQDEYSAGGLLSESYMIEALASEMLLDGYRAYNRYIEEHTDKHVARYHFPGSEEMFPIGMLPGLLSEITPQITCNEAFCMSPKKSVAFLAELTRDESVQCEGICVGCGNLRCSNRMKDEDSVRRRIARRADMLLPYGYSRIFGLI